MYRTSESRGRSSTQRRERVSAAYVKVFLQLKFGAMQWALAACLAATEPVARAQLTQRTPLSMCDSHNARFPPIRPIAQLDTRRLKPR